MRFSNVVTCIDAHTAGEPVRVVTAGFPAVRGDTMLQRRQYVLENLDRYRRMIMREPRGHDAMYGAILTPPVTPDGDIGVLFIDNGGMGTMCGHGTIGVSKVVYDTGMLPAEEGANILKIDTPAGRVVSNVEISGGVVRGVSFENAPSFLYRRDVRVPVRGVGEVSVDICYGGAFYIFAEAASLGLEIEPRNSAACAERAMEIRDWVSGNVEVVHPIEPSINWVYGTVLTAPPEVSGDRIRTRNVCTFGESEVDRSPCGTGTCARMAQLCAAGIMRPGMTLENHSIIGTVFEGTVAEETSVSGIPAIVPRVSGMAYIMGFSQLVLEPDDPMPEGFRMGVND